MSNRRDHTAGLLQLHDLLAIATDSECSIYLDIHVDIGFISVQLYNINFIMIINSVYKCEHACMGVSYI